MGLMARIEKARQLAEQPTGTIRVTAVSTEGEKQLTPLWVARARGGAGFGQRPVEGEGIPLRFAR